LDHSHCRPGPDAPSPLVAENPRQRFGRHSQCPALAARCRDRGQGSEGEREPGGERFRYGVISPTISGWWFGT